MPIWLITIGAWIKGNPIQAIQALCVASLVGLAIYFYFDYTGTKRANADLKTRVEQAEKNYSAATVRIDEFVAAQAKFEADLEAMRQSSIVIRGQVQKALKGLSAVEIEREYRDNPVQAEAALNQRIADLWRMFERRTGVSADADAIDPALTNPH